MFIINEDKSIYITRGDVAFFSIKTKTDTGEAYKFQAGDVLRFKVFEKKACENVVLQKDFGIEAETEEASIYLEEKDTKIGDVISKPTDYWYEVELNPYTDPQTIIGYDEDGAKVFKLFPEGNEKEDDDPITPEDIPVVDEELDLASTRPVQNQAISRAIAKINEDVKAQMDAFNAEVDSRLEEIDAEADSRLEEIEEAAKDLTDAKGNRITNVANPEENKDAVNLKYLQQYTEPCEIGIVSKSTLLKKTEGSIKGEYELYSTSTMDDVSILLAAECYELRDYKCKISDFDGPRFLLTHRDTGRPYEELGEVRVKLYYISDQ